MATGVWGFPQQAKSPARQGGPGQGFAGSVATLPMLATLPHLLHWWASFLKNGIRKAGNRFDFPLGGAVGGRLVFSY